MRNFGRRLKTVLLLTLFLFMLVSASGILLRSILDYEDTASMVVFDKDYPMGEKILVDNVTDLKGVMSVITVRKSAIPAIAYTSLEEVVASVDKETKAFFTLTDVYEGEPVPRPVLIGESPFRVNYDLAEGQRLVSVRFDRGDDANAWHVKAGQDIQLIYTPNRIDALVSDAKKTPYAEPRVIEATIFAIKDANYYVDGEAEYNPEKLVYITFVTNENDAVFIATAKNTGQFSLIQ